MDKDNAETRRKLKQISSVREFISLLDGAMLSEEERTILTMHYKEQKPLSFIADELGLSEVSVKKKHAKMLKKIGNLF